MHVCIIFKCKHNDEILFLFSKVSQMLYLFQTAMLGGMGHLNIVTSFSSFFFKKQWNQS